MSNNIALLSLLILCCVHVYGDNEVFSSDTESIPEELPDTAATREKLDNQAKYIETELKKFIKRTVKSILPTIMEYNTNSSMSAKCAGSLMKYIAGLTNVKVWALKMLDATSKPPAGLLEGTFTDFGGFDTCLEIELPTRKGNIEFRGKYCAIEARPLLAPIPKNFSVSKQPFAEPLDSIGKEFILAGSAFFYSKFRFGICVPSTCTLQDMQGVAKQLAKRYEMYLKIPQCYVKEEVVFRPIHIAMIFILSLLLSICIAGSVIEYRSVNISPGIKLSRGQQVFKCFSFISNYSRLISPSGGAEELKALHGLRALSIAWVILGHSYVWMSEHRMMRRPILVIDWFNRIDFGSILNGWLGVEPFFLISGLLTSYAVMKILPKTKGRINIPIYILQRYVRLTPPLLLTMGLIYFLPLLSSGPFWYGRVEPEIESCTKYWWRSILYISNWFGRDNICIHPTWYLSADFQIHVISVIFLFLLYRSPKLGLSLLASAILASCVMIATLTYLWDLPPIILISSGNHKKIRETVDVVHINTFTHAGSYYVGIITGYLIHKYKNIKMSKMSVTCGWCLSVVVSLTSLYGAHRWNIGEFHGPLVTAIYASLHRTTFSLGVAWVAFACVTGYGGLVNRILSSSMLTPISRLTFLIYLLHSLVIWIREGSIRERIFYSHYNALYEYMGNLMVSIIVAVPFYLLLAAPLSNLERIVFSRAKDDKDNCAKEKGHIQSTEAQFTVKVSDAATEDKTFPVELMSVKHLENGHSNLSFSGDLSEAKLY